MKTGDPNAEGSLLSIGPTKDIIMTAEPLKLKMEHLPEEEEFSQLDIEQNKTICETTLKNLHGHSEKINGISDKEKETELTPKKKKSHIPDIKDEITFEDFKIMEFENTICDYNKIETAFENKETELIPKKKKREKPDINLRTCILCNKVYISIARLEQHVNHSHEGLRPFSCRKCGITFTLRRDIRQHFTVSKKCKKSEEVITLPKSIVEKLTTASPDFDDVEYLTCTFCNKIYSAMPALIAHINSVHHGEKPFTCSICELKFATKRAYHIHLNKPIACRKPDQNVKARTCPLCKMIFRARNILGQHWKRVHSDSLLHSCKICRQPFQHKNELLEHMESNCSKVQIKNKKKNKTKERDIEGSTGDIIVTPEPLEIKTEYFSEDEGFSKVDLKEQNKTICDTTLKNLHGDSEKTHGISDKEKELELNPKKKKTVRPDIKIRTCILCNKVFYSIAGLKLHMNVFHEGLRPFSCKQCGTTFNMRRDLRHHFTVNIDCVNSEEVVILPKLTEKKLVPASPNFDDVEYLTCTICNKIFATFQKLSLHMNMVHSGKKPFSCPMCNLQFVTKRAYHMHLSKPSACRRYKALVCKNCGKSFPYQKKLRQHIKESNCCEAQIKDEITFEDKETKLTPKKNNTKRPDIGLRTCILCNKVYISTSRLEQHMNHFHKGLRPFSCKLCGTTFNMRRDLYEHFTDSKDCSNSEEVIILPKSLEEKLASATIDFNDVEYSTCTICNKVFATYKLLGSHMSRMHNGEVPFSCAICERKFVTKRSYHAHLNKPSACEKPNGLSLPSCKICGQSFLYRNELLSHKRKSNCSKVQLEDEMTFEDYEITEFGNDEEEHTDASADFILG